MKTLNYYKALQIATNKNTLFNEGNINFWWLKKKLE